MLFTSAAFLFVYLPITLAGFFAVARVGGLRMAIVWLTLCSLCFYGYWDVRFVALLLGSIAFNYLIGEALYRARASTVGKRKALLAGGIAVDLAVLGYFKYAGFFVSTVNTLTAAHLPVPQIVLPLGISFFTFTQIAYLVDVYAGKVTERSLPRYALFVTYFPHLIAGPVLHHSEMMPQFADEQIARLRAKNFALGLGFLVIGLAKKVLLADSVAPLANAGFDIVNTEPLTTLQAWHATLAYSLQIYFDFSGYSDMAVGLSLLIGVRLPYNFDSPYKSRSITEFWRRWHMTLSRFLRDYLYIPLGGNRHGAARRHLNLLLTMLLGGLWHGAAWTFVIWGGLHGCYLMCNHGWRWCAGNIAGLRRLAGSSLARHAGTWLGWPLTLLAVMVSWVYFRAESLPAAHRMLSCMTGACTISGPPPGIAAQWPLLLALAAIALFAPNSQQLIDGSLRTALDRMQGRTLLGKLEPASLLTGAAGVIVVMIAMISASRLISEFIYFNF